MKYELTWWFITACFVPLFVGRCHEISDFALLCRMRSCSITRFCFSALTNWLIKHNRICSSLAASSSFLHTYCVCYGRLLCRTVCCSFLSLSLNLRAICFLSLHNHQFLCVLLPFCFFIHSINAPCLYYVLLLQAAAAAADQAAAEAAAREQAAREAARAVKVAQVSFPSANTCVSIEVGFPSLKRFRLLLRSTFSVLSSSSYLSRPSVLVHFLALFMCVLFH